MSSKTEYKLLHGNTARSKALQKLREAPRPINEVFEGGIGGGKRREMVCTLVAPGVRQSGTKSRGRSQGVAYLYGDERRAVRTFIDVNEEYVESCIEDTRNPLQRWDDIIYQMLLEEWDFRQAERVER